MTKAGVADARTVARWGYQLYGDRVVPAELVDQMIAGDAIEPLLSH